MLKISRSHKNLQGRIRLDGSKSISNRILILRALGGKDFPITGLSTSQDTTTMLALLSQYRESNFDQPFDAGAAGTTFRFMTAFLATRPGIQILTGSDRMKQRPVGPLVEALRGLGAEIEYLEEEAYPPLKIHSFQPENGTHQLSIEAGMSSQYISALLMLGAFLPKGIELQLEGAVVSRPYIEMTLGQMRYLGLEFEWKENKITVLPQSISIRPFQVEADWSAASYHYALAAFAEQADLYLDGLFSDSSQGDAVIARMMEHFGVETTFTETGLHLTKSGRLPSPDFEWDFLECPDLAQTIAVVCAGLGVEGLFSGLRTLRIKETDRIAALQLELSKVGTGFEAQDEHQQYFKIRRKAVWTNPPVFDTYEDHRMAMAFAPLGMFNPVMIEDPMVVRKSYPAFWDDWRSLEFVVETVA